MTPCLACLLGVLVGLAVIALAWLGGKLVESLCAQWEEDELRRIAAENADLPDNWRDLDAYHSWLDACAEMRRKTGGA